MLKHALYCSFLVGMVQYPVALNAQKKLETNITVPNRTIRVDELFDLFSKEADLEFSINSKRINLSQMINVTHHSQTVTGWLQDLTVATGISYKIKGDHVILEDQKVVASPVKTNHTLVAEEKTHRTAALADQNKTTQKNKDQAASAGEEKTNPTLTEEEKTAQQVDNDKYKEGLIYLIKEDLHTVYGRKKKKTIDVSIHPENTNIPVVPDSSKPTAPPLQRFIKVDIGPAGLAFGTERRMGQRMTIELSAGLGGGYGVYDNTIHYSFPGNPMAFLSINPRYYINRNRRAAAGRKMTLNSGSYIGFRLKLNIMLEEPSPNTEAYLANIHWGIQRAFARKWLLNAHAGIGYAIGSSESREWNEKGNRFFYPALECRISYIINKPR